MAPKSTMRFVNNVSIMAVIGTLFNAAALACAQTQCTASQLTGGDGIFTISTGNGTYAPGTAQAIIWDQPAGNPVRRISSNITIISQLLTEVARPDNITGAPVVILNRTVAHTGGIGVTIPDTLPDGEGYAFRVIVRSRRGHCYLDTNTFSVLRSVPPPIQNCLPGTMQCVDDNSAFVQCVETDDTDTTFNFGLPIDCAATTECIQITNFTIGCSPGGTNPGECVLGTVDCVDPTHSRVCINGPDGTPIWGPPQACDPGFECNEDNGQCEPGPPPISSTVIATSSTVSVITITDIPTTISATSSAAISTATLPPDECELGTVECVTEISNRVCLIGPSGNAVWGPEILCPAGTTCADGICGSGNPGPGSTIPSIVITTTPAPSSTDIVSSTDIISATTGPASVSSSDPPSSSTQIVTIVTSTDIPSSTISQTTTVLTMTTGVPDECVIGTRECVTETSNRECFGTAFGNTVWGPETQCPAGTTCVDGICGSGNTRPGGTTTTASFSQSTGGPATLTTISLSTETVSPATSSVPETTFSTSIIVPTTFTISVPTTTTTATATVTPLPDECVLGDRECLSDTTSRECVADSTGRAVWQNNNCPAGTTCTDGICSSGVPGGTACFPRSQRCLSNVSYDECDQNDDGFWEFGGVTLTCGPGRVCVPYFNDTINCVIPAPTVTRRRRTRYSFF